MDKNTTLIENTLVGLFDIQAYSQFIMRSPRDEVIDKSKKLYSFAKSLATNDFGGAKTFCWVLSDTIIIVIDTNVMPLCFGSTYIFLHVCSELMHNALKFCNLPIRGAIGYGYFYLDESSKRDTFGNRSFLLGSALVNAAKHEKEQNWLGTMITPEAEEAIQKFVSNSDKKPILDCDKVKDIVKKGQIPLKSGMAHERYYVKPMIHEDNFYWRRNLPEYFRNINGRLDNSDILFKP